MTDMADIVYGGAVGNIQCSLCDFPATQFHGRRKLCDRHYRLNNMVYRSRYRNQVTPTLAELELLIPADMRCPTCLRTMNWLAKDGHSTVAAIQHDRGGAVRILCQGCNARHGKMPGDSFYSLPPGMKVCGKCGEIKTLDEFHLRSSSGFSRRAFRCKPCQAERDRKRYSANPDRMRAAARLSMQKHRAKTKEEQSS